MTGVFVLRRLAHAVVLLLLVSTLSFVLLEVAPGDFLDEARMNPRMGPGTLAALRDRYGLSQPMPVRYLRWMSAVARGDFGVSFAYNMPVTTLVLPRARKTLTITVTALAIAWIVALPLGIWCASSKARWLDSLFAVGTSSLITVPDLLFTFVMLFIAVRCGLWKEGSMVLPAAVLSALAMPPLLRHVRAAMLDAARQPFVRAARAHGIAGVRLWVRQVLPAAANPLVSLLGLSMGTLLSSSLVVEAITGYPGLGPLFLDAVAARDFYLVLGPVMLSAAFLVGASLIADLLLYAVDPRIREPR